MLRTLDVDGGTLYGTTYPEANAFAMDLETEEITEYGRIAPEGDYAWGLDAEDGEVSIGAGTPAQLVTLDPGSGSTDPVHLPEAVTEGGDFIHQIETYDHLRVVPHRSTYRATAQLHDGTDWIDNLNATGMWSYTVDTAVGAFYSLSTDEHHPRWSYVCEAC